MNKILLTSSHLFLCNGIYAYMLNEQNVFVLMSLVYVFSSLNYMKEHFYLHMFDLIVSRVATITLLTYSMYYVHIYYTVMACNNIVMGYTISNLVYKLYPDDNLWIMYHLYFHIITNFCIFVFLKNTVEKI